MSSVSPETERAPAASSISSPAPEDQAPREAAHENAAEAGEPGLPAEAPAKKAKKPVDPERQARRERQRIRSGKRDAKNSTSVSLSREIAAPRSAVAPWFLDEDIRATWLDIPLAEKKLGDNGHSIRFRSNNQPRERVAVFMAESAEGTVIVQIQHVGLTSVAAVDHWRAYWDAHLAELDQRVTGATAS